jgi:hypothetical protein
MTANVVSEEVENVEINAEEDIGPEPVQVTKRPTRNKQNIGMTFKELHPDKYIWAKGIKKAKGGLKFSKIDEVKDTKEYQEAIQVFKADDEDTKARQKIWDADPVNLPWISWKAKKDAIDKKHKEEEKNKKEKLDQAKVVGASSKDSSKASSRKRKRSVRKNANQARKVFVKEMVEFLTGGALDIAEKFADRIEELNEETDEETEEK